MFTFAVHIAVECIFIKKLQALSLKFSEQHFLVAVVFMRELRPHSSSDLYRESLTALPGLGKLVTVFYVIPLLPILFFQYYWLYVNLLQPDSTNSANSVLTNFGTRIAWSAWLKFRPVQRSFYSGVWFSRLASFFSALESSDRKRMALQKRRLGSETLLWIGETPLENRPTVILLQYWLKPESISEAD